MEFIARDELTDKGLICKPFDQTKCPTRSQEEMILFYHNIGVIIVNIQIGFK